MLRLCFHLPLLLITGCFISLTLQGQDQAKGPTSSIVGDVFTLYEIRNTLDHDLVMGYTTSARQRHDVVLCTDRDTLRTKTDNDGKFAFSGIASKQVTLSILPPEGVKHDPFIGTFELMPGDNIIIVPWQQPVPTEGWALQFPDEPIVTMEGDSWVYHYPQMIVAGYSGTIPKDESYLISKLMGVPGVEYDKKKHLLYIPVDAVHCTYVNGAYVFGLKPTATGQQ